MQNLIEIKPLFLLAILYAAFNYLFGCATTSPKFADEAVRVADEFEEYSIIIGTGGVTGVYYPTGGAICKIINNKRKIHGIHCGVESTSGSVYNIEAIMAGDLNFGITQSDRQYQAINGLAEWTNKGPQKDLRAVFSVHSESITLVAAVDAGIKTMMDLKGKKVNIGHPSTLQHMYSSDALTAVGVKWETDLYAKFAMPVYAHILLQDGHIDAFFYTVGHPNGSIKAAVVGKRKVRFVPITGIDRLLAKCPYYARAKIPVAFYREAKNRRNVDTFGVKATFVTSSEVPDKVVYTITKELFENFSDFKKLHPAYRLLTKESMLEGLSAPIHPGALRYYKEVGLQ